MRELHLMSRAQRATESHAQDPWPDRAQEPATLTVGMDDEPTDRLFSRDTTDTEGAAQRGGAADNLDRSDLVLGRYRLRKQLGTGAFGSVWSARDERLDRDVAVKLLTRERIVQARFEREARAAARLQHPGIVTLYEAAVDDDGAYLVSELVRGRTLDRALAEGRLSDREVVEVGVALCDALAHAHDQGVIHRDVKPSNVLVPSRAAGAADRAKLTDFGVAHLAGGEALTRTGDVIGTAAYMAPEQAEGYEVGPLADLYSLALVLYESLSGVNPQAERNGRTPGGRRWFIPPLRRQRRDLPRTLAAGIDRALSDRDEDRGTLAELKAALIAGLDEVGTERGVVAAGWGGEELDHTWIKEAPGQTWSPAAGRHEPTDMASAPRGVDRPALRRGVGISPVFDGPGAPAWMARAANAAGAGFGGAWVCAHAIHWHPVAPAAIVLIVALVALALPLTGSVLTGVALGAISLAGAFPAVVALVGRRWWQRGLFGAGGYLLLAGLGRAAHHDLYWLPARIPIPHPLSLAGAAAWAVACVVAPHLRTGRFPMLDVVLAAVWAATTVAAVHALGVRPVTGAVAGAVAAGAILALPALLTIVEETRESGAIHGGAS